MTFARLSLGSQGERLTAQYLEQQGCKILARNWRCPFGEIDLVALESGEVVFIEVKTRSGHGFGAPEDAVTWAKRAKLRRCAYAYMSEHGLTAAFRIDIFAVTLGGKRPQIARFHNI